MSIRCFIFSLLLVFFQPHLQAETLKGKVISISDGDTITLLDSTQQQHKVRLSGIDAPEKNQAFGHASKKSLSDMVYDQNIVVLWEKRDRYQRILGKVLREDQDVCLEQIKRGMAWHYKKYEREQPIGDRTKYAQAEKNARVARLGLWADESPVEPSHFRRK
jgi:endonuclease YncB( thermonuclease family)